MSLRKSRTYGYRTGSSGTCLVPFAAGAARATAEAHRRAEAAERPCALRGGSRQGDGQRRPYPRDFCQLR
jgi:hypothetical protein